MNGICILCNDIRLLKIVSLNFPPNIDSYKLFIINDVRLGDKTKEIKEVVPTAEVISSEDVFKTFGKTENVMKFKLSIKLIGPWYIFKRYDIQKLLFLDDDVIITKLVDEVFKLRISGKFDFTVGANGSIKFEIAKKAFELFGVPIKENQCKCNGGQILYNKTIIDFDYYHDILKIFIESPEVTNAISKNKAFRTYEIDESFLAAMFYKYIDYFDSMGKYVFLVGKRAYIDDVALFVNKLKTKALIHVIIRNEGKIRTFNNLIEKGALKYED